MHIGDFHFLWECLKVIFMMFWGTPSQPGSLCNVREYISRKQVDKEAKVFNVADEFLIHTFKSHLLARVCCVLKITSPSSDINHEATLEWLQDQARMLVEKCLQPTESIDPTYHFHRSFLHTVYLYVDLRYAIRWQNGLHVLRHWKLWLSRFLGTGRKNSSVETVELLANIYADFPRHISYISVHNRTVNTEGKPGHGKPIDLMMEHYNL